MQIFSTINCVEEVASLAAVRTSTIRCYLYPPLTARALWPKLSPDRELTVEAIRLLIRLDSELREARADWNDDRFRRLMRLRPQAVNRLRRRWEKLNPPPHLSLGNLRRRYHASIAGHLYAVPKD